ncbi:lysine-arginine-ornithine-binding protein [Desulfohalotomaculum tongense]|uniref:basic amino acid ABC transporter substrate-binding protein n=1 Tax=Desulforadius tongensis TaxID=1216062 RepID=UPI0019576E94|nr:basic amino acid ABC transporter substrate-binding protein [Desulforadius tongensis]MBM7854996.1 lysine-arginine-ornithine-binding protein [Desulforadius tongensis]
MKKIVRFGLVTLLVLALIALAGCGSGTDKAKSDSANEANVLKVGTDVAFPPFEFEENGKYTGFDIDLIHAIAEEAGYKVDLQPMQFSGLIPALQAGNVDVGIAGITITDERKEQVNFTEPYIDAGQIIAVRADEEEIKSVDDLKGKVLGAKIGTTGAKMAEELKQDGKLKEIKLYDNNPESYLDLESGNVDAVIVDKPVVDRYIATKGKGKIKTVGELLTGEKFGIAVPKGNEKLLKELNDALATLKENGTYDQIFEKWFGSGQ